jgi:hypothetical protein
MEFPSTHLVEVYRLEKTGAKEGYGVTPVLTGLDIAIYPAGTDIAALYPGIPAFQAYEGYVYEYVSLKNGDKLKSGSEEWILQDVPQKYETDLLYYQRLALAKVV